MSLLKRGVPEPPGGGWGGGLGAGLRELHRQQPIRVGLDSSRFYLMFSEMD